MPTTLNTYEPQTDSCAGGRRASPSAAEEERDADGKGEADRLEGEPLRGPGGDHTRAPESNRAESLLEAPLRRAVLEAVQVDRTESFFSSGAEWRRVRYGPQ